MMLLYFFGVILTSLIVYFGFVRPFNYWSNLGVPQYKFWDIWWKNLVEVLKQPPLTDAMQRLCKDFSGNRYVGIYQLFVPRLCVKDPELIKRILVKDFDHFVDHTMFIPTDGDSMWEKSLFSLKGDRWRHIRSIASPSFTSSKMKFMFGLMLESAQQFMRYLEENQQDKDIQEYEMKDIFGRITNDVFASTHFGVVCDSLKDRNNEMYVVGERGVNFGGFWIKVRFVLIQMIPRITKALGLKLFDQTVSAFFKKIVGMNIKYREEHAIVRPDLIHLFMESRKGRGKNQKIVNGIIDDGFAVVKDLADLTQRNGFNTKLTDEDITVLAMSFFGGGFDSTSTLLCFSAYELALQPNIQQKLQDEIDCTLKNCKGLITYEHLLGMKFLDMVITETLRKWPGGFFLDRRCVKPYTIEPVHPGEVSVHLNKGDSIYFPLFALQRDPDFYPDPDRFIPERFSDENKAGVNPYMYMPFGAGPRHCIGNRFALLEAKVVLLHVLSKFSIEVVAKTRVPLRLARRNFQLTSKDGFWLGLKRRTVA